jgi:hypothetical protein
MIFQLTCRDNVGSLPPMRLSLTVPSTQNVTCCNEYRCNVSKKVKQAALDAERRQAMPYSISTLLIRNLGDVFGENDPARRRAAIDEIYTEDCVFYDPRKGVYRGRDEIDRIAGAIKATHPEFRYQPTTEPAESGNGGLVRWVSGRPGEAPAYAGTDFIIARDGRIAAVYLFFDKLP